MALDAMYASHVSAIISIIALAPFPCPNAREPARRGVADCWNGPANRVALIPYATSSTPSVERSDATARSADVNYRRFMMEF
jgi:hypothetical protein